MVQAKQLLKATLGAGRAFFRSPTSQAADGGSARSESALTPALVPIRGLGRRHRARVLTHLLALEPRDRYLRFGYAANDEQIGRYVAGLDFERDDIFGVFNRKLELIAMAHLAFGAGDRFSACAEFGVSVLAKARGRGLGKRLFDRAAMHARNQGVELLFIHALTENAAMLKIARNAGAVVERDGSESQAHLRLPQATMDTRMSEIVEHQLAEIDYRLKTQARQFWDFLGQLQAIRRAVRNGRRRTGN